MKAMRCLVALLLLVLLSTGVARADVAQGVAWLAARDAAAGVHRPTDLTTRVDTNAEAWFTLHALGNTSGFGGLRTSAAGNTDEGLAATARQALVRLQQGSAASEQIEALLAQQRRDGGFPSHPGSSSDPLATAWVLQALDASGRGAQTPAQRALAYLLSSQRSDGGWTAVAGGDPSLWATASVAPALQRFAGRFALTDPLTRARNWLLAQRGADQGFGELFESALALDALLALRVPHAQIAASVQALAARQAADGSFAADAYQTALALRVLHLFAQPEIPANAAGLRGRVLSADTGLPITGATLTLEGASNLTLSSNNRGELLADNLTPGAYRATLAYTGMQSATFEFTVPASRILDLGDLRMYQGSAGGAFAVVRGRVLDNETGLPLPGARVRLELPPNEVVADADGRYQFLQVPAGAIRITASADGYSGASAQGTVAARDVAEITLRLNKRPPSQTGGLIRGTVLHGETAAPLDGVQISVAGGAAPAAGATAADGSYQVPVEADGEVTITAQKSGFDPVTIRTVLIPQQIFVFSPRLYPTGETPDGANTSSLVGVVVNQANRQPLANALIVVSDAGGQQSLRSASDGRFEVRDLVGPEVRLAFSADAFDPARLLVPVVPLERRDLGTIGLKPTAVDFYLPDLAIVDSTLAETHPDTFSLEQSFEVEVVNRGTSNVSQDFTLLAYVDANGNGRLDAGQEQEVGRTRVSDDLPIGGAATVAVAVNAQLNFRDAPVAFRADVDNEVPEQNEDNNDGSSLFGCRVTPAFIGDDTVHEAWRWSGLSSNPSINSLNQVPVVGQLTDDNADGAINEYDIPDLVFVAARRNQYGPAQTALVAIDGKDGSEHWARTDVNLSHFSSLALGDLDNDGVAEIVGVRGYREELLAFEHNGTLKWRVALPGPGMPEVLIPPPPYVYDQPIIVNLEGDNEGEVILGRLAFRGSNGELLWEGQHDAGGDGGKPVNQPVREAFGIGSIAADINMDGLMEVIAGRTAYDVEGRTLWHRADIKPIPYSDADHTPMNKSGLNAIGNFDIDDFPEIVLAINDELWLLEHDGTTIWGPKFAPDFGDMGAPSVADLDRDGLPEIMISTNDRLTIFESDGTVKWTTTIKDNSGVTSATVFDFENDGLYEVIHMDEEDFRIFDALTGARLYETRNTSVTVYELPVVADIDGDKQAEVILTGFERDLVAGPTPGIRVFKARNGAWADAGSVWGSQAFHIDEVNEDSTLPLIETPSWLTHNTYRVQRSPMPDPLGMPDFSVGDLRLIDQGPARNPTVQVRVGNAGPVDAHEPAWIGVYRGDPAAGGRLLAETRLDTLRPARAQVVNLGEVALTGSGDLFAVVDARARANECREGNNARSVPFAASNGRGELSLSTGAPSYAPGQTARIDARVENRGGVPAAYRVELELRNAQNRVVATFEPRDSGIVTLAAPVTLQQPWFTGDALAGTYRVEGRLLDLQGRVVDTASALFAVAGDPAAPAATLRIATDKGEYRQGEAATLLVQASNRSDANIIRAGQIAVTIDGPQGTVQQHTFTLDDLFPGARFEAELRIAGTEPAAAYTARATLRSTAGGDLASASTAFLRLADSSADLSGTVQAQWPRVQAGSAQSCLMTVRNIGNAALDDVQLRRRVVAEAGETVSLQVEEAVDLSASGSYVANQNVSTRTLAAGVHACVLEARQGNGWRILASDAFEVLTGPPPGVLVTPRSGLVTDEGGRRVSFSVVLASAPTASVRIPLEPSDAGEWRVVSAELSFGPTSWNVPRTVEIEGLDDSEVDGDQLGLIRLLPAVSDDAGYLALDADDVELTNLDNDGARILVVPQTIETSETGSSASFSVSLSSAPAAAVQITLESSDASEWRLSTASLQFDAQNWNVPQAVVVTGADDVEIDGLQLGTIRLPPATSADPAYQGNDATDVQARNLDDDGGRVLVDPLELVTRENGPTQAFRVRLSARPSAPVAIAIGPVDASEWSVDTLQVVLDAGNWSAGALVPVQPVDDAAVDGPQAATLALEAARSDDAAFDGIDPPDVSLRNLDDDGARVLVETTGGVVVSEAGTTAEFLVRLSEAPTAPVTIPLTNPDAGEFELGAMQVRFEAGQTGPLAVSVKGVDDSEVDGNVVASIALGPVASGDARYAGQDPQDVVATNLDDESAQIQVEPEGVLVTSEGGTTASLTVRVNTAPTAAVTVTLQNPDASEWQLPTAQVVFTADNWTQPQTLVLMGVDDELADGDQVGLLRLPAATSTDVRFAGIDPRDLPLLNLDDEAEGPPAALVVDAVDLALAEDGATGLLRISLNRTPSANVVVSISSDDLGEASVAPLELTFTPQAATQPQDVVLTGVDDAVTDGDQPVSIRVRVASSADAGFATLPAQVLTATNVDDDTPEVRLELSGPGRVMEGEGTTLLLRLGSRPQAPVTIDLEAAVLSGTPPPHGFTVTPARVVVAPEQWHQPVTLQLQTRHDAARHGEYVLQVRSAGVHSTDPAYEGLASTTQQVVVGEVAALFVPVIVPIDRGPVLLLGLLLLVIGGRALRPASNRKFPR
jgi:hypothetical protein